ncbi:magnesium and cobalt transport protein CorA [Candidatus Peregrinibacteria bacterium CG10_big_fil_rev_8_21_14_0_10_36_19]|nr:MAG: magnesium and cobalt transport protein CorA [Candidatus Peregrinibacteria bacterium CG10_big_fil_rev_8_21_14_0_10_36_19]
MAESKKYKKIKFAESDLTWISLNDPTEAELASLRKTYKFHHLDLEDCLSETQRPKIDDYDNYLFIVLQAPKRKGRKGQVVMDEIDIFIGQNFIVTVHDHNTIINKVFENCRKSKKIRSDYMSKGSGYLLYMIVDDIFEAGFPLLDDLSKQVNELEVEVFHRDYSKDRLKDILLLKKDIINFRRIIMPQRAIIAQLEHKNKKFLPENLDVYFDDIVDKIEKMWNSLENLQELTASLQETNESIISHNTNNVIKILTIFSVIMLPLTFITGFYGMNVNGLPFAQSGSSVAIISSIFVTVAIVMVAYFRYKKWI